MRRISDSYNWITYYAYVSSIPPSFSDKVPFMHITFRKPNGDIIGARDVSDLGDETAVKTVTHYYFTFLSYALRENDKSMFPNDGPYLLFASDTDGVPILDPSNFDPGYPFFQAISIKPEYLQHALDINIINEKSLFLLDNYAFDMKNSLEKFSRCG